MSGSNENKWKQFPVVEKVNMLEKFNQGRGRRKYVDMTSG
jgi:hypothetical protein